MDKINNYNKLTTEQINDNTRNIDTYTSLEIVQAINNEDAKIHKAVLLEKENIAKAIDIIVNQFKKGGRLIYVGAGTSGRLGILDASECPPTFGVSNDMVIGIIAGGDRAIQSAVEGAEDDEILGKHDILKINISKNDVVVGISASGSAAYVNSALKEAKTLGCFTIGISNSRNIEFEKKLSISICPVVGPEVLLGSTRMKSGTAQKMVLNMLSTGSMIKLGKAYYNLMVDLQATNKKLINRAERIVIAATSVNHNTAKEYLEKSNYNTKYAIVMILADCSLSDAILKLKKSEGFIKKAIK